MPEPSKAVEVVSNPETGTTPKETFQDLCLLGTASTTNEPTPGFNQTVRYSDPADVGTDYGDGSNLHEAAKDAAELGVESFITISLESTSQTEVVGGADGTATDTGSVSSTPIAGDATVTVTVDGTDMATTRDVTTSPPSLPDGETLGPDTALVNRSTGEVKAGTEASGSGTGIEVSYSTLSWSDALVALEDAGVDLLYPARKCDRSDIGDLEEADTWAGSANAIQLFDYAQQADAQTALDLAVDVGQYLSSPDSIAFSAETTDYFGAMVGADLAIHQPWYDPYFESYPASLPANNYKRLVGEPGQDQTFEGGDNGSGVSNVLVRDGEGGDTLLSNSLTTSGLSSPYRYLDVRRTESFLKSEARLAVKDLLKNRDKIGFNRYGRGELEAALNDRLQQYAGGERTPCNYIKVHVPDADDLPESDRADRVWTNITLEAQLSGNMHRAKIDLVISV